MTQDEIRALITQRAQAAGIDPQHALTIASIESSFDPNAGKTNDNPHKGLFQFGPSEWGKYGGGGDVYDPNAQINAFIGYHNDIKNQMAKMLGRDPTPQELYLGWQQGAQGATNLINNPTSAAASVIGSGAFNANAGKGPQTSQGFVNQWANTYNQHQAQLGQQPVTVQATPPATPPTTSQFTSQNMADAVPWAFGEGPKPPTGLLAGDEQGKRMMDASNQMAKSGLGLLSGATTSAPRFSGPQAQAHRPQVQSPGMPDFTQILAQQRLLGRA